MVLSEKYGLWRSWVSFYPPMPLLGNKNVALQRHRRVNSMCEYSKPSIQTGGTAARRDAAEEALIQSPPPAPSPLRGSVSAVCLAAARLTGIPCHAPLPCSRPPVGRVLLAILRRTRAGLWLLEDTSFVVDTTNINDSYAPYHD